MAALEPSINDSQMTALMVAAQSTLSAYAPSPQIVISDVALAPTGQWIVVWSDAAGGAASRPIGSGYAFSGNYGDGTTNRIVAEVRISFSTPLGGLLRSISLGAVNVPQTITLTDTYSPHHCNPATWRASFRAASRCNERPRGDRQASRPIRSPASGPSSAPSRPPPHAPAAAARQGP